MQEQPLLTAHSRDIWVTQKTATQLLIEHSSKRSTLLHGDISAITGLCLNDRHLVITNNRAVVIYKIAKTDNIQDAKEKMLIIKQIHTFNDTDCVRLFIWDETVIILGHENIKFYSLGGIVLRDIYFNDNEGEI